MEECISQLNAKVFARLVEYQSQTSEETGLFEELFAGLDMTRRSAVVYHLVFLIRRSLFILVAIFWHARPDFQIFALLLITLVHLLYLALARPFEDESVQRLEIVNDSLVYFSVVFSLMLLVFKNDSEVQDKIGWVFLIMIFLNILFNMVVAFKDTCKQNLNLLRRTHWRYKVKMRQWDEVKCTCPCQFCGTGQVQEVATSEQAGTNP